MPMSRLNDAADTLSEVVQYYNTRARQMLHAGVTWSQSVQWHEGYANQIAHTSFVYRERTYDSLYVLASARGQGLIKPALRGCNILTTGPCGVESLFQKNGTPYVKVAPILESPEYKLIEQFYGDKRANRSQMFLMNHIDEGLAVIAACAPSEISMRAFCLHPLLQNDEDLAANFLHVVEGVQRVKGGAKVLALAMEYRSVANEYLAQRSLPRNGIRLSPLAAVNAMLIADKVQNRKDFELYHQGTHHNSERLTEYFAEWCDALGISEGRYKNLKSLISLPPHTS